jgi:DNA-binding NarL/FixJ family response regulator
MSSHEPEPLRCLVVEDQLMFSQLLCTLVDAIPGIQVIGTATSQAEGLEQCTAQPPPDLLLLDLALPDGPGLAIADALLAHHPTAKVVVLSGEAASFICPSRLQSAMAGVVDKTAAFSQLQVVLQNCLKRPPQALTARQQQIYALIGKGMSNKEIAHTTNLAITTVETHRKAIAQKLGTSGAELVRQASLLAPLTPPSLS